MAYVVARPGGKYEIRESIQSPRGPRPRTLARFRDLDDATLERAAAAATTAFDRERVLASARRAGVAPPSPSVDQAARHLLLELRAGRRPSPGLRRLLIDALDPESTPTLEAGDSIAHWIGVDAGERGRTLRDLLDLADRIPHRRRGPLRYPTRHELHG
jgi:hypothetical protein